MLDWRRVVQNKNGFTQSLMSRGVVGSEAANLSESIEAASKARVSVQQNCDVLKAKRNQSSEKVSTLMRAKDNPNAKAEAEALIQEGKKLGSEIAALELELSKSEESFNKLLELVPNWPHESVPVGATAAENRVVRSWGTKRNFSFEPKSHDELGAQSELLDFERAGKISGTRFTFLRAGLAQLERALANFMLDLHRSKGYQEIVPPYMVTAATMFGMGQFPKFIEDVFKIEGQDKYLIPTSEVPVTSFFAGEIVPQESLPVKFVSFSPCFRSEAGSYGKDTKGLIRQHQFHKVELVKLTEPEKSLDELELMVADAEAVLQALEIPYKTLLLCTGDMGFNSRKTYDIEVWLPGSVFDLPGQGTTGRGCHREISSCSDCGDFQARRAGIRFKSKAGKGTTYVHTLNGSGLAVGRTLVAVMENYQTESGAIEVPKVLRPYMQGLELIEPLKKRN